MGGEGTLSFFKFRIGRVMCDPSVNSRPLTESTKELAQGLYNFVNRTNTELAQVVKE